MSYASVGFLPFTAPTFNFPTPDQVVNNAFNFVNQQAASATPTGLLWLAPPSVQQAAANAVSPLTNQAIGTPIQQTVEAQNLLMQLGVYPGPASGVADPNTMQALNQFRQAVGLPQSDSVTAADIAALRTAVQMMARGASPDQAAAAAAQAGAAASGLPAWVLPAGAAVVGGLVLWKLLGK